MKRERLIDNIENLKAMMPSFVLEYYRSKSAVPYALTTLYEYLKEYHRFFTWMMAADITQVSHMQAISLKTLENLTKSDLETYILYLRERPRLNATTTKYGVSQSTINRTLSALSSLYKYLRERIINEAQLQYNAMQLGVFDLLRAREQQIQAAVAYIETLRDYWLARTDLGQLLSGRLPSPNGVAMERKDRPKNRRENAGH